MLGQIILISLCKTNMSFLFGNKGKIYQIDWCVLCVSAVCFTCVIKRVIVL